MLWVRSTMMSIDTLSTSGGVIDAAPTAAQENPPASARPPSEAEVFRKSRRRIDIKPPPQIATSNHETRTLNGTAQRILPEVCDKLSSSRNGAAQGGACPRPKVASITIVKTKSEGLRSRPIKGIEECPPSRHVTLSGRTAWVFRDD